MRSALVVACIFVASATQASSPEPETYAPSWESLARHEAAPEWFRDAKLGIYFHWGVYSVPAYANEWYPRLMHLPGHDVYRHHLETYGLPSEFGYHDFVPMFGAEHFDAEEWAQLFQEAGARFAGPVAEHHDGFAMWDSDVTPWNAADMGPHRDVLGELATALRRRDMRVIATFHHARNLQRYEPPMRVEDFDGDFWVNGNSHYPLFEGMPPASDDPTLRQLYGRLPEDEWLSGVWAAKVKEVVDRYAPDVIWFDSWLDAIPERHRQEMAAHYLNAASRRGQQVVIVRKQNDLPLAFSVLDHEKSRTSGASDDVWMTDDTISRGSWCYTRNLEIKPAGEIIHALADTVAKNGVVLLNVSPMADGTIPEDQRSTLRGLGHWLATNGEAIYATRPWVTYGEGPTREPEGGFEDHEEFLALRYTAADVRYTRSQDGRTVHAIVLGVPDPGTEITLAAFTSRAVARVSVLGSDEPLSWRSTPQGLVIAAPSLSAGVPAFVYRVELEP